MPQKPRFFSSQAAFRTRLEQHHVSEKELWVGFYKKSSGRPSITWPEAVDVALCFGWIDGIRKSLEDISYMIRFTPRKSHSTWSAINIRRIAALRRTGLMHPAGEEAFAQRDKSEPGMYSYEQRKSAKLGAAYEQRFRADAKAWSFFRAQAPWYQRVSAFWVISAKKEETRLRRLVRLIEDSAKQRTIAPLTRPSRMKASPSE